MKKTLQQLKWVVIFWTLGVGSVFLLSLVLRFVMTLAGMQVK